MDIDEIRMKLWCDVFVALIPDDQYRLDDCADIANDALGFFDTAHCEEEETVVAVRVALDLLRFEQSNRHVTWMRRRVVGDVVVTGLRPADGNANPTLLYRLDHFHGSIYPESGPCLHLFQS